MADGKHSILEIVDNLKESIYNVSLQLKTMGETNDFQTLKDINNEVSEILPLLNSIDLSFSSLTAEQIEAKQNELNTLFDNVKSKLDNDEFKGDKGSVGSQGIQGEKGDIGLTGSQGIQGKKGDKGLTGSQGIQGEKGDIGLTGSQGIQGKKGDIGSVGSQGIQGEKGDIGSTGAKGEKGDTVINGKDGIDGLNGVDGINGKDGKSITFEDFTEEQKKELASFPSDYNSLLNKPIDTTYQNLQFFRYGCGGTSQGSVLHLKTNIPHNNKMLSFHFNGFHYNTSSPIFSFFGGYSYADVNLLHSRYLENMFFTLVLGEYYSSDGFLVLKLANATDISYIISLSLTNELYSLNVEDLKVTEVLFNDDDSSKMF